jgi:hypothetical protein
MDFADITYSIPLANIFSGLEPSLAVILACVPLLRPLLGRAGGDSNINATPYQASGPSGRGKINTDQFDPLDDDSSHVQLNPVDGKHHVDTSTFQRDQDNSKFARVVEDLEMGPKKLRIGHGKTGSGISVKREWEVSR